MILMLLKYLPTLSGLVGKCYSYYNMCYRNT